MLMGSWLVHTVTRKRRTGNNDDGTPAYGSAETLQARVEKRVAFMRNPDGKEVRVQHRIVVVEPVSYDDVFWLPSINGEPADDTSSMDDGRSPAAVEMAMNKPGLLGFSVVGFP